MKDDVVRQSDVYLYHIDRYKLMKMISSFFCRTTNLNEQLVRHFSCKCCYKLLQIQMEEKSSGEFFPHSHTNYWQICAKFCDKLFKTFDMHSRSVVVQRGAHVWDISILISDWVTFIHVVRQGSIFGMTTNHIVHAMNAVVCGTGGVCGANSQQTS